MCRPLPFLAIVPAILSNGATRPLADKVIPHDKPAISQARNPARVLNAMINSFLAAWRPCRAAAYKRRTSPGASTLAGWVMDISLILLLSHCNCIIISATEQVLFAGTTCYAATMAIVFGLDDEDFEPVDWLERMDLVDEASWLREQLSNALVFFDLAVLDAADPAGALGKVLESHSECGALRLGRWGYLTPGCTETRAAIAKLEHERSLSPLVRYQFGTGALLAAVISAPLALRHLVARCMAKHAAFVGAVDDLRLEEISRILLPAGQLTRG